MSELKEEPRIEGDPKIELRIISEDKAQEKVTVGIKSNVDGYAQVLSTADRLGMTDRLFRGEVKAGEEQQVEISTHGFISSDSGQALVYLFKDKATFDTHDKRFSLNDMTNGPIVRQSIVIKGEVRDPGEDDYRY